MVVQTDNQPDESPKARKFYVSGEVTVRVAAIVHAKSVGDANKQAMGIFERLQLANMYFCGDAQVNHASAVKMPEKVSV